jgi:hypothetical protein
MTTNNRNGIPTRHNKHGSMCTYRKQTKDCIERAYIVNTTIEKIALSEFLLYDCAAIGTDTRRFFVSLMAAAESALCA